MSCKYTERFNPITGETTVYGPDGVVTDETILANLVCCPTLTPDKEEVCLQPIKNTDPALITPGWLVSTMSTSHEGVTTVVGTPTLMDHGMLKDISATHEVVPCPNDAPVDTQLCFVPPKGKKVKGK